jgi:two-component system, OmpR family, manganese sensing sensor histidine kinase
MTKLTENLLLLSRSDYLTKLQTKVISLSLTLSDLIQLNKSQIEEKKLIYQQELEADLFVLGDEMLLKQLFNNLLQNAIYYTAVGGKITLEAQKNKQNYIIVKVKDTGIGIAPEHLDKIFERFWRVDKSRSYQTGKAGLGLAIVQDIIQLHKGKIFVESQLGIGSCFIVHLPVKIS